MRPSLSDLDPRKDHTPTIAAAAAFVLGWLIFAWPWLSGRVTIPWDGKAQFLPPVQFLAQSLHRGESPFWNPFVFGGYPQIADPQALIFSPPMLLLALLDPAPGAWALDCTVYLSILAGGLALIAWFRDRDWHPAGAVLAALVFAFGAAMSWRVQHMGQVLSLVYLSITLLTLDRALSRDSWAYGIAAGLFGAFMVLGRDQVALLGVYLLVVYVVWRLLSAQDLNEMWHRANLPLAAGMLAGLAVVAVPVLLTFELAGMSNRPEIDFEGAGRGSLHPGQALTLFAANLFASAGDMRDFWGPPSSSWPAGGITLAQNMGVLYLGAIPALLLLFGLGSGTLWRREIRFFTCALAVMFIYAIGWNTPLFKLAHSYLPGVDLYRRPADAVFLIGFLGAILAGYSAHVLLSHDHAGLSHQAIRRGQITALSGTLAAFAIATIVATSLNHLGPAARPIVLSMCLFALGAALLLDAVWILPIRPVLASAMLIAFTVADLAICNGPGSATALPPAEYDMLEPQTHNETIGILKRKTAESRSATRRDRVELAGLGFAWPNASETHGLENTLGYNPLRLELYSLATGAGDNVGSPEERHFAPLFPSYKSPLANLLGLRYIATSVPLSSLDPSALPGDFPLIAQTGDGYIYENPRALPRVMFASSAAPADLDILLNMGRWPDVDLESTVLLSAEDLKESGLQATRGSGSARITSYSNTEVVIDCTSTRGGYVVLNDLWHPWWVATLDGTATPILRANVLFRAVRVPYGHHTVRFTFAPVTQTLGSLLTR